MKVFLEILNHWTFDAKMNINGFSHESPCTVVALSIETLIVGIKLAVAKKVNLNKE